MKKIIFITGATAGFGKATAEIFAENGHHIIITGRRNEKLLALKGLLETKYKVQVYTLNFDVREEKSVQDAVDSLPNDWKNIDVLVNNAGLASGLDLDSGWKLR